MEQDYHWLLDEDYSEIIASKDGSPVGNCSFVNDDEMGLVL